jgi:hypothetical protein
MVVEVTATGSPPPPPPHATRTKVVDVTAKYANLFMFIRISEKVKRAIGVHTGSATTH